MHMVVAINMIEGKTGTPEGLKLSPDFLFQLFPHPRAEEKIDPGPEEMGENCPLGSTRSGMAWGDDIGVPLTSTRWSPTRNEGSRPARSTASLTALAPTIRLAVLRTPLRWASSIASFTAKERPKSSAVTISFFTRETPSVPAAHRGSGSTSNRAR